MCLIQVSAYNSVFHHRELFPHGFWVCVLAHLFILDVSDKGDSGCSYRPR